MPTRRWIGRYHIFQRRASAAAAVAAKIFSSLAALFLKYHDTSDINTVASVKQHQQGTRIINTIRISTNTTMFLSAFYHGIQFHA